VPVARTGTSAGTLGADVRNVAPPHPGWDDGGVTASAPEFFAGRLLVATPQIENGPFRRAVVLVLHHEEGGAQGVVLNRPLEAEIDSVLPGWQAVTTLPQTLFEGGPVELNSAIGLATVPGDNPEPMGVKHLFRGLGLVDLDAPPNLVAPEVAGLRIFAGYAGWSPSQLEEEVGRGDWYVVDYEARDAFTAYPDSLWSEVLGRQGDNRKLVALFPDDPSMN